MASGLVRIGGAELGGSVVAFSIEKGRPIAGGRLADTPNVGYRGHHLAGFLRSLGARQPGNRVPVAIASEKPDLVGRLERILREDPAVLAGDPTWLQMEPCRLIVDARHARGYLLTPQQTSSLSELGGGLGAVALPNAQVVEALVLDEGGTERPMPPILAKQPFTPSGVALGKEKDGWWTFQSRPSSDFRSIIPSAHAFHVVLHERFKRTLGSTPYLVLRNRELEARFPMLDTRFPVRRCFSKDISPECAAVEETALLACGIREGEACWLAPMSAPWWRTLTPFAYRQVVCRVGPSTTVDQDKPLCRLPESVLDVLGTVPGELILVETLNHREGGPHVVRRSLRAIPERTHDDAPALRGGAPDFFDEVGSVDLPVIRLDGVRQKELGVARGSPLYVRPRVSDYLLREGSAVGLLLIGGVIATLAGDRLLLAAVLGSVLVAGAVIRAVLVIRR